MLIKDPSTGKLHAPRPGEIYKNPFLAETFRSVAEKGKAGFYEGRIAEAIVERESQAERGHFPQDRSPDLGLHVTVIQSQGGVMTLDDLKNHTTTPVTPISINYGGPEGVTLHETPPNGQGLTALIALGILEAIQEQGKVDLHKTEHMSALWLHTLMWVGSRPGLSRPDLRADVSSRAQFRHSFGVRRHPRVHRGP